jgi:CBS domain-containing protein
VPEEEIMDVASILKSKGKNVITGRPDAKIATIVHKLKDGKIGALVVSEDNIKVQGIISERDIVRGLADHGLYLLDMRVDELMTREVFTCAPTDQISKLMAQMTERRIRHLPVMENGALCGIVSIGDVVKVRLDEIEYEAKALRDYISGA